MFVCCEQSSSLNFSAQNMSCWKLTVTNVGANLIKTNIYDMMRALVLFFWLVLNYCTLTRTRKNVLELPTEPGHFIYK